MSATHSTPDPGLDSGYTFTSDLAVLERMVFVCTIVHCIKRLKPEERDILHSLPNRKYKYNVEMSDHDSK